MRGDGYKVEKDLEGNKEADEAKWIVSITGEFVPGCVHTHTHTHTHTQHQKMITSVFDRGPVFHA